MLKKCAQDTLEDPHSTHRGRLRDRGLTSKAHLVQVDAPEVETLGKVAQDALKDASAAIGAALVELNQRSLAQHLRQALLSTSPLLATHRHLRHWSLCNRYLSAAAS